MNFGLYHPSLNPHGCKKAADNAYWYNTTETFNTKADCFNPTKLLTNSGTISSANSGRPDSRYYDAIYASGQGGVIDDRPKYGAWDASSSEQSSEVWQEVVSGEYRGREKLVFSLVTEGTQTSSGSSNAIIVDDVSLFSVGDLISIVDSGAIVADERVVESIGTSNITFSGDPIARTVTTYQIVISSETDTTIESEFLQTDVIGDPANILLTDDLKDGWLGGWIPVIPSGSSQDFPLTRKNMDSQFNYHYSDDNGVTWGSATSTNFNSIENLINSPWGVDRVNILNYTAAAHQTEKSENLPVLHGGKGLGDVSTFSYYTPSYGALLHEGFGFGVITNNFGGAHLGLKCILTQSYITPTGGLSTDVNGPTAHYAISFLNPNNSSNASKALPHQISEDNQANLNVIANELIHDGTDWGDDSTVKIIEDGTYTNLNGDTCKTAIHKLAKPYGWIKNDI